MLESEHGLTEVDLPPEHPLLLELDSLRVALARYQHELHVATSKAAQTSHTSSQALERAHTLSRENAVLRTEIATLRASPDISPHPAQHQVSELSLSLRHMSDKLTATEEKLVYRTLEAARAETERRAAVAELNHAHERIDTARAAEDQARQEVLQINARLKATEQDLRLSDHALREYADLVRSLEAQIARSGTPSRHITDSSSTLVSEASQSSESLASSGKMASVSNEDLPGHHLSQARTELQNSISSSLSQEHHLSSELSQLKASLADLRAAQNAASEVHETDLTMLANLRAVVDRMSIDDATSAKMVSRYMKFSQTSTNTLQSALAALKVRHAASLETLHFQLADAEKELALERTSNAELRRQLEDATEDLAREAYGRRREVALRLRLLAREEKVADDLRRCNRELYEAIEDDEDDPEGVSIEDLRNGRRLLLEDLDVILTTLDGPLRNETVSSVEEHDSSGSLARLVFAEDTARNLMVELDREIAHWRVIKHPLGTQERAVSAIEGLVASTVEAGTSPRTPVEPLLPRTLTDASSQTDQYVDAGLASTLTPMSPTDKKAVVLATSGSSPEIPSVPPQDPRERRISTTFAPHVTITPESPNATYFAEDLDTPVAVTRHAFNYARASQFDAIHDTPDSAITPTLSNPVMTIPNIPTSEDTPSTPTSISPGPSEQSSPSPSITPHPLIGQLKNSKDRYTDFQQSFQDLHHTLTDVKASLSPSSSPSLDSSTISTLRTVVNRLDDVNEDIRVELEIQIADEERLAEGYIALLSLASLSHSNNTSIDGLDEEEVQQFIDGTNPKIARALANFTRKRDELEHDVAQAKRVFDAQSAGFSPSPSLSPEVRTTSLIPTAEEETSAPLAAPRGRQWSTWTEGLFSSSRASSPAPPPKFGSVLTMPRSLRPSASATSLRSALSLSSPEAYADPKVPEPLAKLGLNLHTPMPTHLSAPAAPARPITPVNLSQNIPRPRYPSMFGHHQSILGSPTGRTMIAPGPRAPSMPFSAFVAARSPFSSPAPDSGRAEVNLNVDSADDDDVE